MPLVDDEDLSHILRCCSHFAPVPLNNVTVGDNLLPMATKGAVSLAATNPISGSVPGPAMYPARVRPTTSRTCNAPFPASLTSSSGCVVPPTKNFVKARQPESRKRNSPFSVHTSFGPVQKDAFKSHTDRRFVLVSDVTKTFSAKQVAMP
jgi:hypothetical protein